MALEVTEQQTADETDTCCGSSRRALLRAAGVGGAAAAVAITAAACGSSSNGGSTSAGDQGAGAGAGSAPSTAASTAASSGSGSGGGAALAATSDVPVDGGKIVTADNGTVITQPAAGTYKAFTATCTHAGCTVGSVTNNQIMCPCHGSVYSAKDGSVINGPATQPLAAKNIKVSGGSIFLA